MTSCSGGTRSIQLSYGRLSVSLGPMTTSASTPLAEDRGDHAPPQQVERPKRDQIATVVSVTQAAWPEVRGATALVRKPAVRPAEGAGVDPVGIHALGDHPPRGEGPVEVDYQYLFLSTEVSYFLIVGKHRGRSFMGIQPRGKRGKDRNDSLRLQPVRNRSEMAPYGAR